MDLIEQLTTETFPAFCRERGLKCTAQRIAVFAAVRRVMGCHPSVAGIWETVKESLPSVCLRTSRCRTGFAARCTILSFA